MGSSKHVIVAVAARSKDSAESFAKKFGVSKSYDRYEALADDPEIDVVYIGVINTCHLSVGLSLLAAHKPVLCEKPLCINLAETQQLVDAAKKQKTFLMEAVWSRYLPAYREIQARLDKGALGELTHAYVTFGVPICNVPRVSKKDQGGGSVLDIGIYAINFILFVFGGEKPLEVKSFGTLNEDGVESEVTAMLQFSNNRFGTFTLSTKCRLPNEAYISGTKGTIKLEPPFWCSTGFTSPTGDFNVPLEPSDRVYNFDNSQSLKFEAEEVARCLKQGELESPIMPLSASLVLAELIQTIRQQVGVKI